MDKIYDYYCSPVDWISSAEPSVNRGAWSNAQAKNHVFQNQIFNILFVFQSYFINKIFLSDLNIPRVGSMCPGICSLLQTELVN